MTNILTREETMLLDLEAKAFELELENMADKKIVKKILADNNIIENLDQSTARFSKAEWYEKIQEFKICMCGVGGIGSNAAYTIAHLHPQTMVLYDDDKVDEVNLAGQFFDSEDIGDYKVDVMKRKIFALQNFDVTVFRSRISAVRAWFSGMDVVVAGFDNMEARKITFESWKRHGKEGSLFIDGRMSVNVFQLFCMRKGDKDRIAKYEKDWLFDQSESESNICSYKQTYFCATMMSGVITSLIINYAQNLLLGEDIWPLPFFVEEDTTLLSRRIEND